MEKITDLPATPGVVWGDRVWGDGVWGDGEDLWLNLADGLARLRDGTIGYLSPRQTGPATPGPHGGIYTTQGRRVLRICAEDSDEPQDLTEAFGGPPREDGRIVCDGQGSLHIRGCTRYRRHDGSYAESPALEASVPLPGSNPLPLGADLCGNLWSLSADGLCCHLLPADAPDRWLPIPLPSGSWVHLIVDHAGFVWIAGSSGIRRFAPRQHPPEWQTPVSAAANTPVTALGLSPDGLVLVALETGDLIELDIDAQAQTIERHLGTTPGVTRALHTDTRGIVWIATEEGLYREDAFTTQPHAAWELKPGRLPGGGNHDIFTTTCDQHLYGAGGLLRFWGYPTSQHCFGELFRYDPGSGYWQILDDLPFPRRYNGIATLAGSVWLVGGEGELHGPDADITIVDVVDVYEPSTASWSAGPRLQQARTDPFVMSWDGRIWAAGGSADGSNRLTSMESLGVGETTWRQEPDLPAPAREGGCCALDGVLYCASLDGFFAFDTRTGQWDLTVPPPEALVKAPLMAAYSGEVWMMGGTRQDRTQCYDPASRQWHAGPHLPTQQSWGGAAVLNDQLIITGGAHRSDRHDMTIYDDRTWVLRG